MNDNPDGDGAGQPSRPEEPGGPEGRQCRNAGADEERADERMPVGWLRMYALVFEFLAYLGGLGYFGWWLDDSLGWQPWGLLSGLLLGTALGTYRMIRESGRLGL